MHWSLLLSFQCRNISLFQMYLPYNLLSIIWRRLLVNGIRLALNRLTMDDCSVKQAELLTWWWFHKLLCSFLHEADMPLHWRLKRNVFLIILLSRLGDFFSQSWWIHDSCQTTQELINHTHNCFRSLSSSFTYLETWVLCQYIWAHRCAAVSQGGWQPRPRTDVRPINQPAAWYIHKHPHPADTCTPTAYAGQRR